MLFVYLKALPHLYASSSFILTSDRQNDFIIFDNAEHVLIAPEKVQATYTSNTQVCDLLTKFVVLQFISRACVLIFWLDSWEELADGFDFLAFSSSVEVHERLEIFRLHDYTVIYTSRVNFEGFCIIHVYSSKSAFGAPERAYLSSRCTPTRKAATSKSAEAEISH